MSSFEKRPTVCIVGAGAAGYATACRLKELLQDEVDITIIEARDRIGGRILTTDLAGKPVANKSHHDGPVLDLGAQVNIE